MFEKTKKTKGGTKRARGWNVWVVIGIRSWGKGSETQELERFREGGEGKCWEEPGLCNKYFRG